MLWMNPSWGASILGVHFRGIVGRLTPLWTDSHAQNISFPQLHLWVLINQFQITTVYLVVFDVVKFFCFSNERVIFRLTYSEYTWLERQTIMLKGNNLTCTNYAKSAPIQVYYESIGDCITLKPCKIDQESVNKTNCNYSCTCSFEKCGTIFVMFNEPQYSSLCDIVFLV